MPTDFDLGIPVHGYLSTDAGLMFSHALSRRSSLSAGYNVRRSGAITGSAGQTTEDVSSGYSYALSKALSLRLGYSLFRNRNKFDAGAGAAVPVDAQPVSVQSFRNHAIDAGLSFNKALSFSRRTRVSFSSGSVAVSDGRTTRFDVVGNATLSHQFGRTWSTGATYDRNVMFVQTFALPTFSDSLSFYVDGQLSSRVNLSAGAGSSLGGVGLGSASTGYSAYQATVGASIQVTRLVAIAASYAHYRYGFDDGGVLSPTIASRGRRHSFQLSTGVALPLIARMRRSNASR